MLLEDEQARTRNRERFRASHDVDERRAIVVDALARVDRQVTILRGKIDRLEAMIVEAEERRNHLAGHVADLDAGREPSHAPHGAPAR